MRSFNQLTKAGIVFFVLLSGLAGYAMSFNPGVELDWIQILTLLLGLYLLSSGSFALNQSQEWQIDIKMNRTKTRPIPAGIYSPIQGYFISVVLICCGLVILYLLKPLTAYLGLFTVVLYNGFYTLHWKRQWTFGAVPGAIPGAMPAVIGYSLGNSNIFTAESVYMFLIMFLWQMPHFWVLAIRFKDDYNAGGVPILPIRLGVPATLYQIGLYVFAYVGVAIASPWFLKTHIMYILIVVPICIKLIYEFFVYFKSEDQKKWLPFFLWTNFSMLIFLSVPIFDKWLYILALS